MDDPREQESHSRSHDLVTVWPHLLFPEVLATIVCLILFFAVSILLNAPLESPADPADTPNPAKAPWYFVGLQELLVYFDPWIAGVMIPLLIIFGLCAIPYIDPSRRGGGVYSFRERPLAFIVFTVGLVWWFLLILVGAWFRGPGWQWVWPGHAAAGAAAAESSRSLPNWAGLLLVIAYFGGGSAWLARRTRGWHGFTRWRRWAFTVLALCMGGVALKIALRLLFGIKYLVSFSRGGFNL